jgi:hypothetical protein
MSDIVIDADIMRSAGTSEHPNSSNARKLLDAVWDAGHRMVQCAPIKEEYDRHQGRYASLWRTKMISKKLWVHWKYKEDKDLRRVLVDALPDGSLARDLEVLKDAHLLEAAAATDKRIVSKDATARNLFRLACPHLNVHKSILWGDLTGSPAKVIQWVDNGCAEQNDFRLCPQATKKVAKKAAKKRV